jgi:hypothetical protein
MSCYFENEAAMFSITRHNPSMLDEKLPCNLVNFLIIAYFLCILTNNYLYLLVQFASDSPFAATHSLHYCFLGVL